MEDNSSYVLRTDYTLMSVSQVLKTFDKCKDMILEECDFTSDEQVAAFIISAVQDRVMNMRQKETDWTENLSNELRTTQAAFTVLQRINSFVSWLFTKIL